MYRQPAYHRNVLTSTAPEQTPGGAIKLIYCPWGGLDNLGPTNICLALHQEMELLGCYLLSNLSLNYPHAVQSIGTIHDFQTLQVYNKKYNTMKTFVIATMLELENNCHIQLSDI